VVAVVVLEMFLQSVLVEQVVEEMVVEEFLIIFRHQMEQ
jgi:hypothetical protein